jgi:hypothetical protein
MQLHLETDELDLIANILLQREGQLSRLSQQEVSSTQPGVDLKLCEELLDRVLARDTEFDSDELEQLAELLAAEKDAMNKSPALEKGSPPNALLLRKRSKLERVLEKIDEVCAMI